MVKYTLADERFSRMKDILNDGEYLPHDNSNNGYRGFIADMKSALEKGRSITPKMNSAINKAIKSYDEWKDPDRWYIKTIGRDRILMKLTRLRGKLEAAGYTGSYTYNTEQFLESIEKQARRRGTLSMGQMQALNRMYKRFNKRAEKNIKKTVVSR